MNAELSLVEQREKNIVFAIAHQHMEQGLNVHWICGNHLYRPTDKSDDDDQRLFLIMPRETFEQIHHNTFSDPSGVCRDAILTADVIIKVDTGLVVH